MAKKIRVVVDDAGSKQYLNSPSVMAMLDSMAKDAASRAGPGNVGDVRAGQNRARGMVKTTDRQSMIDNARNNTILRALGGVS